MRSASGALKGQKISLVREVLDESTEEYLFGNPTPVCLSGKT